MGFMSIHGFHEPNHGIHECSWILCIHEFYEQIMAWDIEFVARTLYCQSWWNHVVSCCAFVCLVLCPVFVSCLRTRLIVGEFSQRDVSLVLLITVIHIVRCILQISDVQRKIAKEIGSPEQEWHVPENFAVHSMAWQKRCQAVPGISKSTAQQQTHGRYEHCTKYTYKPVKNKTQFRYLIVLQLKLPFVAAMPTGPASQTYGEVTRQYCIFPRKLRYCRKKELSIVEPNQTNTA